MTADVSDAALSPPSRRGALYVAEYRLRNMWKWRGSIVAFGIGNPVLYLASVGIGVGALVDANGGGVDGVPYLVFLAPALIAAAAIQGGTDEAMFPSLHGFIWSKLFFSIRATSVTGGQIADGVLLATVVRVVFTSAAYWCVLWAFGAVGIGSALPLIAVRYAMDCDSNRIGVGLGRRRRRRRFHDTERNSAAGNDGNPYFTERACSISPRKTSGIDFS